MALMLHTDTQHLKNTIVVKDSFRQFSRLLDLQFHHQVKVKLPQKANFSFIWMWLLHQINPKVSGDLITYCC